MDKEEKKRGFEELIGKTETNENDIQRYLEEHTELIPLPFLASHQLHMNVVISKLPIGGGYITDFAYLTKCSDYWNLVLIELEDSKKKIFKKDGQNIRFHHEFNDAYGQIESWKAYLEQDDNKNQIKRRLKSLMGNMYSLPFYIKYVLVYGRGQEKDGLDKHIMMFNQKNTNDITVKTYDSIISEFLTRKEEIYKVVLSLREQYGFKIKHIPVEDIEISLFCMLNKEQLSFDNEIRENLIQKGYCIEAWENGKMLTEDFFKKDKKTYYNSMKDGLPKKILEAELRESGEL